MKKNVWLLMISVLFAAATVAQTNYQKAWQHFNNNERGEARRLFELAAKEPVARAEALLSLALLDKSEHNFAKAFSHFKQFYESSSNPYPYLYAMWSEEFNRPGMMFKEHLSFFEQLAADPKMNGTLKAMLYDKLGNHYRSINNFKKSDETFARIGTLNNWQVLGAFSNISGSGFDKDWGVLNNPQPNAVFKNKVNADVKWFTPTANREDNWFLFDYSFVLDDVVVYAQTFVQSRAAQEVYLRVGTSGSLKVWVNDAQVMTIPEERNCDLDIYATKIKLNAGNNRILVQIGQSEITRANFMLRLTDEHANPVKGLTSTAVYSDYEKNSAVPANNLLPFFAEQFFEERIQTEPENILNYLLLSKIYLRNDKAFEGKLVLKKADLIAPKSSLIREQLSEAYLRARNRTDYSREIENIKQNDPESFNALLYFYNDAIESERYTEAENYRDKIKKLYGESETTDDMDIQLLSSQNKIGELVALGRKMYAKYPHNYGYLNLFVMIQDQVDQKPMAALKTLENYNKRYFNSNAMELLASKYPAKKGFQILKARLDKMPYATGLMLSYANQLRTAQRYSEALAVIQDVKKIAPYVSNVHSIEGYIHREMRNDAKARESFQKSVYYGPTSYDSRTQLRLLDKKPEVFNLFPKVNLDSLIAASSTHLADPEKNSIIILSDSRLVFYPEGAQEQQEIIAVKILNYSGVEAWKEYGIGVAASQRLLLDKYEIIKPNKQRVRAETDGEGTVVFTNLEVGDVLYLEYRLQDHYSGSLSKHFYGQTPMQYFYPAMMLRRSILVPSDKIFEYKTLGGDLEFSMSDVENMELYQWTNTNVEAAKEEPFMPSLVDVAPCVVYSSIPDWNFIGDWYKDVTANKFGENSDFILKTTFAEILAGNENASDLEKARLFYEYILNNITYSSVSFMQGNFIPQKASRTITTRLGDCKDMATLFVALCREAGINANIVLMSTRDESEAALTLPSVAFNHAIASLEINNKTYYLELTSNKLPFGSATSYGLQAPVLKIPYKDEKFDSKIVNMDMPFRSTNGRIRNTKITIADKDMQLERKTASTGLLGAILRHIYADLSESNRLKELNEIIAGDWTNPVQASNLKFINLDNLKDTVTTTYNVEAKNALQDVASMKLFKFPWTDKITSPWFVASETRRYPFEFWAYMHRDHECEEIVLSLGGMQFVEMPKNIKLDCSAASYELTFEHKANGIVVAKRSFSVKQDIVKPADYTEFKKFIDAVVENDTKQYAIR
jgi:predicted Zn-dependent protease